jgi:hypothetical protein
LGETFDDDQGRASAGVMVVYGMRALLACRGTGRHITEGSSTLSIVSAQTISPGGFDCVVIVHTPYTTKEADRKRHCERLIAAMKPTLEESA